MDNTYRIVLLILLLYSAYTDIKTKEIMMVPVYACILMGLLRLATNNSEWLKVIYGLIPGMLMLLFSFVSKGAIGEGDAYLFVAVGMLQGFRMAMDVMIISFLIAAVFSIGSLLLRKIKKSETIAFAPFVLTGYLGALIIA